MPRKTIAQPLTDQMPKSKRIDFDIPYNDDSDAEYDAYDAEQETKEKIFFHRLMSCFKEAEQLFGNADAVELFQIIAKRNRVRRKKGKHDPDYDSALLEANKKAPKGEKTKAVLNVKHKKNIQGESTKRRLARLKKEETEILNLAKDWLKRQREKSRQIT